MGLVDVVFDSGDLDKVQRDRRVDRGEFSQGEFLVAADEEVGVGAYPGTLDVVDSQLFREGVAVDELGFVEGLDVVLGQSPVVEELVAGGEVEAEAVPVGVGEGVEAVAVGPGGVGEELGLEVLAFDGGAVGAELVLLAEGAAAVGGHAALEYVVGDVGKLPPAVGGFDGEADEERGVVDVGPVVVSPVLEEGK